MLWFARKRFRERAAAATPTLPTNPLLRWATLRHFLKWFLPDLGNARRCQSYKNLLDLELFVDMQSKELWRKRRPPFVLGCDDLEMDKTSSLLLKPDISNHSSSLSMPQQHEKQKHLFFIPSIDSTVIRLKNLFLISNLLKPNFPFGFLYLLREAKYYLVSTSL